MSARRSALLCLDSGTTVVKAAVFDREGRVIASAQRENRALRRDGDRVEQDMGLSRDDAFEVLRICASQTSVRIDGILVTGQGDGLWSLDADLQPVGPAMTWLDGRTRQLIASLGLSGHLSRIREVTWSRPTSATQSLQLLWLKQNSPDRIQRVAHALRLKEWLFYSLTGELLAEPSAILPTWGSWRTGAVSRTVQDVLGLSRGLELLPTLSPVSACRAGLSATAAKTLGLLEGTPVLQGPGDVQSTLIGLGLGLRPGVSRASIFGTSAIHAAHVTDADAINPSPEGAIVLKFVLGDGYFHLHPCFNGATVLQHLRGLVAALPERVEPAYSSVIVQPFFEPAGERAPYTTPDALGSVLGINAETSPAQIAWAAREALAFIGRKSYQAMQVGLGPIALGGGLANDGHFASFFATVMNATIERVFSGHASLRGLAAIGAKFILGEPDGAVSGVWCGGADDRASPQGAMIRQYAERKFAVFERLAECVAAEWPCLRTLQNSLVDERAR